MKHFLIITNSFKDAGLELTGKLKKYIEIKGGSAISFISTGEEAEKAAPKNEEIPDNIEGVIVLGGDGTLIRAASSLVKSNLPLIGINMGTLGYLCELEAKDAFSAVDVLMKDNFLIENRMMLDGYGIKAGSKVAASVALNDIVIHRTGSLSVVNLIVYVNGEYLNTFHGDGIIISTPTGSTGYNMSAGGPIVDPKAQMILITPINAHNLNSRSIVIGARDEVTVEIGKRRSQKDETVEVSFDGDNAVKLEVGDKFIVHRAKDTAKICKLSKESFLEILRRKMQAYT
ncbi:MAG: NAD(+)/NADH kinase [Clostridiales bacterium]|nr:NAD(+)/NADH kinase [Clostridiales bacterium]